MSADTGSSLEERSLDASPLNSHETSTSPFPPVPISSDVPAQRRARILTSRVSLSCDSCHRRKIKCDARQPSCANCQNIGVRCQTLRALSKRGRKARGRLPDTEILAPLRPALPRPQLPAADVQTAAGNLNHDIDLRHHAAHFPHQDRPEGPFGPNSEASLRVSCTLPCSENVKFHVWLQDLSKELLAANVETESVISYIKNCVELFYNNIYPIYPIIYKPSLLRTLVELQDPGGGWDTKPFLLLTSICAYTLAVLPTSISGASWSAANAFYGVFKKAQNEYGLQDMDRLDSSSVVMHLMHAAWHHVSGNAEASWYVLGQAMNTALLMRLHDEKTYEAKPFVERQLCRRAFWALYTGCQASCFLGDHPSIFNKALFSDVTVPKYPEEWGPDDQTTVTQHDGRQYSFSILTGFNANQDLWRAAENLLQEVREADLVDTARSDSRLTTSYHKFCAILDNLPTALRFHNSVDITLQGFSFADQKDHQPRVSKALTIQRTNLHISHQYLKLFFLRNCSFVSLHNPLQLSTPSHVSLGTDSQISLFPTEGMATSPASQVSSRHDNQATSHPKHAQTGLGPGLALQILQVAEDMLYVIHTSGVNSLRINGEPCTEKIRRVAASILEVLAQDAVDASSLERAVNLRDLYPHLLARLESKASDERHPAASEGSGATN